MTSNLLLSRYEKNLLVIKMREIKNWINSQNINLSLAAESELETIDSMMELVRRSSAVKNIEALAQNILDHETIEPSLSGNCAVVFRAMHNSVIKPQLFFGRFDKGIGYISKHGEPIDLIFLIVAPPEMENEFNAMIQKMEPAIFNAPFRERLRAATNSKEVVEILTKKIT